jgi:hypothetical protein
MAKMGQRFPKLWFFFCLLNGVPGKQFKCKRGVGQGDPVSPLLYVMGGDVLQSVVNDLLQNNLLQLYNMLMKLY